MPRTLATARYSIGGYQAKVLSYSPGVYWPLNETSGTVADNAQGDAALDGAYSGVILGRTTFVNGEPAGFWNGLAYCNIYSAALNTLFSGSVGTLAGWGRLSTNTWIDATFRRAVRIAASGSNEVILRRTTTGGQVSEEYTAGGVSSVVSHTTASPTSWFHFGVTWDKAADQLKFYYAGVQQGGTQTGLGTWAGSLSSTLCVIGASNTSLGAPWIGFLAHFFYKPAVLDAAAFADLAVVN